MHIAELASRSPTLKRMIEQSERAHQAARMLSLTSVTAAVALLQAQADRATAALPQITDELFPRLTPERFDQAFVIGRRGRNEDDALRALSRRVERLEHLSDEPMSGRN